jgi:hypothetical protein
MDTVNMIEDSLNFMLKIKPEDVPLTTKYGIRITATPLNLSDVANMIIPERINNLGISGLTVTSINTKSRDITVNLDYNGQGMSITI